MRRLVHVLQPGTAVSGVSEEVGVEGIIPLTGARASFLSMLHRCQKERTGLHVAAILQLGDQRRDICCIAVLEFRP